MAKPSDLADAENLLEVIDLFLKDLAENGYIAINAFVPRLKDEEAFLQALRTQMLNRYNRAQHLVSARVFAFNRAVP